MRLGTTQPWGTIGLHGHAVGSEFPFRKPSLYPLASCLSLAGAVAFPERILALAGPST